MRKLVFVLLACGCTLADPAGVAAATSPAANTTTTQLRRAAMRFHRPELRRILNRDRP